MMTELVRIALARPYTFLVLAIALLLGGGWAARRMPADIFPALDIPVIVVAWQYGGLSPDQMAGRLTVPFQRVLTTVVNDIEHIEAHSYTGIGIIRIFFHKNVDISVANAQVTAVSQTLLRQMPPGTTPPMVLNYSAATVPVLWLALSGRGLSEQALTDLALIGVRTRLVTVPGASIPYPFGGKSRQVQLDLNPEALRSHGLSGQDVGAALASQNVLIPAGTQKVGDFDYFVQLNNTPATLQGLADLPIRATGNAMIRVRDVAQVRDGSGVQTNIVHVEGTRSALLQVLKNGNASTLAVIEGIQSLLSTLRPSLPEALEIKSLGDQSVFVKAALNAVIQEGVLAAVLTSLMILLFLGNWQATLIIAVSIPLSVFGALAGLALLGETLNIMTLGGLALAVGILVDEATVTLENINWHLEQGKPVETAILDGAEQIVTPAFVSLLCICVVFIPLFMLEGLARFLFVPLAEAVMLAMAWSFVLSRTLVPTLAKYLLKPHAPHTDLHGHDKALPPSPNPLVRVQRRFEAGFESFRAAYRRRLQQAMTCRTGFMAGVTGFVLASFLLVPWLGQNFFPEVDAGQIRLHVRVPPGTRVEETAHRFAAIEKTLSEIIPADELGVVVDNIGLPVSSINMSFANSGITGSWDGVIQVSLNPGHRPTAEHIRRLRERLPVAFPGTVFSFMPADMVAQILNFGAPAPIDLQIRGNDTVANHAWAHRLIQRLRLIPGIADVRLQQTLNTPAYRVEVDRSQARWAGVTERDVANSMVLQLAGSNQVAPVFWLDPKTNVPYPVVMQTPQYRLDSLEALSSLPISSESTETPVMLGGIARINRTSTANVVSHYDIQNLLQIFATPAGRDLGGVARAIEQIVQEMANSLPKGSSVVLLGQYQTLKTTYAGLLLGLVVAIGLIYLLIVVNFQSWTDPFVIVSALPAALAGIVWMLFITRTSVSVPALTGAILCMGVATANSVLVISFARERLAACGDALQAAVEAGFVRCRPVLMTALAMIIGMIPLALGLGEGGEQNAPLGRAVIGGLMFATVSTLWFVPVVFATLHTRRSA